MDLREHQVRAIEMVRDSMSKGNRRVILAAPCGFGKTITAAAIAKSAVKKGKRVLFVCDRIKLVEQSIEAYSGHGLEFGVIQAQHHLSDGYRAPIQIASVQTLVKRKDWPHADLIIVDEAHVMYKSLVEKLEVWNAVPVVGLTATPFSKGLGKIFSDVVVPITTRQLQEQGWLANCEYYVGKSVDTKGIKTKALTTGGSDYDPEELGNRMSDDIELTGSIVDNYRDHSNGLTRRAVAFAPNIAYSKNLVEQFNSAGIPAAHIDGYTPQEERDMLYRDFERGDYKVLSCSRLLGVGWDDPGCEILIDCFPCKSIIAYQQRAGRILRTAAGKEKATYLDHAGNVSLHGFAEDIVPESLDDGEKRFKETEQVKKEEKEPITHTCPQCTAAFQGRRCDCGYILPADTQMLKDDGTKLVLADGETIKQMKQRWISELMDYCHRKGFKPGWASHKYREKFGVWPVGLDRTPEVCKSKDVMSFIAYANIRSAKRPARAC